MRRWGRHRHDDVETALANFALTFAKALLVFCVILFVMITENKKTEDGIRPKVEAMIQIDWPAEDLVDIDTWVREPSGKIVYYNSKEGDEVFLDRDDLGNLCHNSCEEITSLRALTEGEYVLNLVLFTSRDPSARTLEKAGEILPKPIKVHVRIVKMNPVITVLFEDDIMITRMFEEKHVTRFTVVDNLLTDFNHDRPVNLVQIIGK